eukprot:4516573-Amphidinium_carterae.1
MSASTSQDGSRAGPESQLCVLVGEGGVPVLCPKCLSKALCAICAMGDVTVCTRTASDATGYNNPAAVCDASRVLAQRKGSGVPLEPKAFTYADNILLAVTVTHFSFFPNLRYCCYDYRLCQRDREIDTSIRCGSAGAPAQRVETTDRVARPIAPIQVRGWMPYKLTRKRTLINEICNHAWNAVAVGSGQVSQQHI